MIGRSGEGGAVMVFRKGGLSGDWGGSEAGAKCWILRGARICGIYLHKRKSTGVKSNIGRSGAG